MKAQLMLAAASASMLLLVGCETIPPGAERGPHNTMAYNVVIEASEPGAMIKANGQEVGKTPVTLKIYGDPDGTFHDFGSYYYVIQALPVATNQFTQTKVFRTGRGFTPEDMIPGHIHFDMSKPDTTEAPAYLGRRYYGPEIIIGPPIFGPRPFRGRW
jgi:hypothetical protein